MNTIEATLYLVGTTEDDAQANSPFDSIEAATSFQEDNGGTGFMARTLINSDSIDVAKSSPLSSDEVFFPAHYPNPFDNGVELTLYLTGDNADMAEESMPFIEEGDAVTTAEDNEHKVYEVQAFLDFDSMESMV